MVKSAHGCVLAVDSYARKLHPTPPLPHAVIHIARACAPPVLPRVTREASSSDMSSPAPTSPDEASMQQLFALLAVAAVSASANTPPARNTTGAGDPTTTSATDRLRTIMAADKAGMVGMMRGNAMLRTEWTRIRDLVSGLTAAGLNSSDLTTLTRDAGAVQVAALTLPTLRMLDAVQFCVRKHVRPFVENGLNMMRDMLSGMVRDGTINMYQTSAQHATPVVAEHYRQQVATYLASAATLDELLAQAIASVALLVRLEHQLAERLRSVFRLMPDLQLPTASLLDMPQQAGASFGIQSTIPEGALSLSLELLLLHEQRALDLAAAPSRSSAPYSAPLTPLDARGPAIDVPGVNVSASTMNAECRTALAELNQLMDERAQVLTNIQGVTQIQILDPIGGTREEMTELGLDKMATLGSVYFSLLITFRKYVEPFFSKLAALHPTVVRLDRTFSASLEIFRTLGGRVAEEVDGASLRRLELTYIETIRMLMTSLQSVAELEKRLMSALRAGFPQFPGFSLHEPTYNVRIGQGVFMRAPAAEMIQKMAKMQADASKFTHAQATASSSSSASCSSSSSTAHASVSALGPSLLVDTTSVFAKALLRIKHGASTSARYTQALSTLANLLQNVILHPLESKYRSMRHGNAALRTKLLDLPGGVDALHAVGFVSEMRAAPPAVSVGSASAPASASPAENASSSATSPISDERKIEAAAQEPSAILEEYHVLAPSADAWLTLESCARTLASFRRAASDVGLAFCAASSLQLYDASKRAEVVRLHLDSLITRERAREDMAESAARAQREGAGYAYIAPARMGTMAKGMTPSNIRGLCMSGLLANPRRAVVLVSALSLGLTLLVHVTEQFELPTLALVVQQYSAAAGKLAGRILFGASDESREFGHKVLDSLKGETAKNEFLCMVVTCDAVLVDVDSYSGRPDMCGSDSELHRSYPVVHHPSESLLTTVGELHRALPLHFGFSVSMAGYSLERWSPPADNDAVLAPSAREYLQQHQWMAVSTGAPPSLSTVLTQYTRWRAAFLAGLLRDGDPIAKRTVFTSEREVDRLAAKQTVALTRYILLQHSPAQRAVVVDEFFVASVNEILAHAEAGEVDVMPPGVTLDAEANNFVQAVRHVLTHRPMIGRRDAVKQFLNRASSKIAGAADLFQLHCLLILALEASVPDAAGSHCIAAMWP